MGRDKAVNDLPYGIVDLGRRFQPDAQQITCPDTADLEHIRDTFKV